MQSEQVGVIGGGVMGHGIAQVAAQAGFTTVLCDVDAQILDAAVERIRSNLDKGIERGKVTADERDAAIERITTTTELSELAASSDVVIEAVPENLNLKKAVFDKVEAACSADTLLATNTSSLSIGALAEGIDNNARFLGMHFFNPVHLMKLLEIVVHAGTAPAALERARELGDRMSKTSIVVKDVPGFATSRLGVVLGLEAMRMVEQGVASVEEIDTAMELGYRHPMGPLKLTDLVGLDTRLAVAEYLHQELGSEAFRPPEILQRLVEEGRLGKKSGRGFYEW